MVFLEEFTCDWRPLAQKELVKLQEHELLQGSPEVRELIEMTRGGIRGVAPIQPMGVLLEELKCANETLLRSRLSSPDPENFTVAREIQKLFHQTINRILLLEALFHFQLNHFETRFTTGGQIGLGTKSSFEASLPPHVHAKQHWEYDFGMSVRGLVAEMGFPVIVDTRDKDEIRDKVAQELWRAYNNKNGLPGENRTYRPDTTLPTTKDIIYFQKDYTTGFGTFEEALRQVFSLQTESQEKEEALEPEQAQAILSASVKAGRKIEIDEKVEKSLKTTIIKDILKVVERYAVGYANEDRADVSSQVFNWRFILWASQFFREFGLEIYYIWLSHSELEQLTQHENKYVSKQLRMLFIERRCVPHLTEVPKGLVRKRTVEEDYRKKKEAFFQENPEIPFYMRRLILAAGATPLERTLEAARAFEEAGIRKEIYVHFLHVIVPLKRDRTIRSLLLQQDNFDLAAAYQDRVRPKSPIDRVKDLFRPHIGKAAEALTESDFHQVSIQIVEARIRRRIAQNLEVGLDLLNKEIRDYSTQGQQLGVSKRAARAEAETELSRLGYPFEKFGFRVRRSLSPVTILKRVKIMIGKVGTVHEDLMFHDEETLQEGLGALLAERAMLEEADERTLQVFLDERGVEAPPEYLKKHSPAHLMKVIREIEEGSVPFKTEYWWWVNASQSQRATQVESMWRRLNRTHLYEELVMLYGLEDVKEDIRLTRKEPDTLWEYCKIVRAAGGRAFDWVNLMNKHGIGKFAAALGERFGKSFDYKTDLKEALVFEKLRRARFGYAEIEFWCESAEKMDYVLERVHELEQRKEKITRQVLHRDWQNGDTVLDEKFELSPDQALVYEYLVRSECFEGIAQRVALSGESLDLCRAKVAFFQEVKLDREVFGKESLEVEDYEGCLLEPLAYCRRYGLPDLKKRLREKVAISRLRAEAGIEWDHEKGWTFGRVSATHMLSKFLFVGTNGDLLDLAGEEPTLITRYSSLSLMEIRAFAEDIHRILSFLGLKAERIEQYVREALRIVNQIAQMTKGHTGRVVSERLLQVIRQQFFDPRSEMLRELTVKARSNGPIAEPLRLSLTSYYKLVSGLQSSAARAPEDQLWARKETGDPTAKEALYFRHLGLVRNPARYYSGLFSMPEEDLIQEGNIGLLKAIDKFDRGRGIKFPTHARWWIRASMTAYIRDHSKLIRIPGHVREGVMTLNKALRGFVAQHGCSPKTTSDLATFMGISEDETEKLLLLKSVLNQKPASLDAPLNVEDDRSLGEMIGTDDPKINESLVNRDVHWFRAEVKRRFLATKKNQETAQRTWDVYEKCIGLKEDYEFETNAKLGEEMRISRERVRQLKQEVTDFIESQPDLIELLRQLGQ